MVVAILIAGLLLPGCHMITSGHGNEANFSNSPQLGAAPQTEDLPKQKSSFEEGLRTTAAVIVLIPLVALLVVLGDPHAVRWIIDELD